MPKGGFTPPFFLIYLRRALLLATCYKEDFYLNTETMDVRKVKENSGIGLYFLRSKQMVL
jgi:hypothetical protein